MTAVYLTSDLMFSSRVTEAARASGVEIQVVPSADALADQLNLPAATLVILDLSTVGAEVASVAQQVRQQCEGATIVAYAPHVHGPQLQLARDAGCDEVLTRGQFSSQIQELLAKYARA